MSGDEARCLFCGKPSSEGVSWAVGYATGLTEGMSKLCELRAAVRIPEVTTKTPPAELAVTTLAQHAIDHEGNYLRPAVNDDRDVMRFAGLDLASIALPGCGQTDVTHGEFQGAVRVRGDANAFILLVARVQQGVR